MCVRYFLCVSMCFNAFICFYVFVHLCAWDVHVGCLHVLASVCVSGVITIFDCMYFSVFEKVYVQAVS